MRAHAALVTRETMISGALCALLELASPALAGASDRCLDAVTHFNLCFHDSRSETCENELREIGIVCEKKPEREPTAPLGGGIGTREYGPHGDLIIRLPPESETQ